jgi:hypothetical protein
MTASPTAGLDELMDGPLAERLEIIRRYAELRPRLAEIRRDAIFNCTVNPLAWMAVQGVSLADYLARLDDLDEQCAKCQAEIAGLEGAASGGSG